MVDRAHGEHEPLRDLRVGQALAEQLEHVQLALGEAERVGPRGRARAASRGHPGGAQPRAHAGGRAGGVHGVEDPQALGDGPRVAGLGQLERPLVGIARGRPAVGGRAPVAAQARRPRARAAVERLGGEAGAREVARQLGAERRAAGVREPRRERGRDALGDLRPPGQPRPLHRGEARVRDPEQQPLALRAVPGPGQQAAGRRVAAAGQRAAEPGHAVGEQHPRVLDAVHQLAQARERRRRGRRGAVAGRSGAARGCRRATRTRARARTAGPRRCTPPARRAAPRGRAAPRRCSSRGRRPRGGPRRARPRRCRAPAAGRRDRRARPPRPRGS